MSSLADVMSLMLPTPAQTAMLRAALHRGAAGRDAWSTWQRGHGGAAALLAGPRDGAKRLLPLLAGSAADLEIDLAPAVRTCLRTARLRETVRAGTFDALCRPALAALADAGVRHAVLPGAALAHAVYAEPGRRHCHDLDVLVNPADRAAAVAAIASAGFPALAPSPGPLAPAGLGVHDSGLPIALHERLAGWPGLRPVEEAVLGRLETADVGGAVAPVPAPDDALVHVCGHAAASPGRHTLVWVADAWCLLDRTPALAWDRLAATAAAAGLALPLLVALRYLATELGSPVPASTLETLAAAAASPSRAEAESIFFAAAAGPRGSLRAMLARTSGVSERLAMARWLALPDPGHLRWRYGDTRAGRAPLGYAWRLVDGTVGRLRRSRRDRADRAAARPEFMGEAGAVAAPPAAPRRAA